MADDRPVIDPKSNAGIAAAGFDGVVDKLFNEKAQSVMKDMLKGFERPQGINYSGTVEAMPESAQRANDQSVQFLKEKAAQEALQGGKQ